PGGVDARNFQRLFRNVTAVDLRQREFAGQSQGNAARPSADVKQADAAFAVKLVLLHQLDHGFDHMFRFGPGNEHRGRDQQVEPPELLVSGDVLGGTAARPLAYDLVVLGLLVGGELAFRMGVEKGALAAQHKHQQQLGIQAGRGNVIRNEELESGVDGLLELHGGENLPQSTREKQNLTTEARRHGEKSQGSGFKIRDSYLSFENIPVCGSVHTLQASRLIALGFGYIYPDQDSSVSPCLRGESYAPSW